MIEVQFIKLDERAKTPRQAYPLDAGWDLFALETTFIKPGARLTWVRTGIAVALPDGYFGRVVGRSSAASKGYHVIEGTIDGGYRGEQMVRVCPLWLGDDKKLPSMVKEGESLGQLIVQEVRPVRFVEVTELAGSVRGQNGYGSSDAMREATTT